MGDFRVGSITYGPPGPCQFQIPAPTPYDTSKAAVILLMGELDNFEKHLGYKKTPEVKAAMARLREVYSLPAEA